MKKLMIGLAAVFALSVIFLGADTFACGGKSKTAAQSAVDSKCSAGAVCPITGGTCPMSGSESCSMMKTASANGSGTCSSAKTAEFNGAGSCSSMKSAAANGSGSCSSAKTAEFNGAGSCSSMKTGGMNAAGGCCSQKAAKAEMSDMGHCNSNPSDWTANLCGSKGYYAANVFATCHGHEYAVFGENAFEVTDQTPFLQDGRARYYFPDEQSRQLFAQNQPQRVSEIEQETVSLATADGNVVSVNATGEKIAQCPVTGKTFVVTADSPVKVLDGKRYYMNGGTDLSTVSDRIHQ